MANTGPGNTDSDRNVSDTDHGGLTRRTYLRAVGGVGVLGSWYRGVVGRAGAGSPRSRTLTVVGNGSYTAYSFTVSGDLEAGAGLTGEDTVSGSRAVGAIRGGKDSYRFSGELLAFSYTGNTTVLVDGERLPPEELLPRTLTIEGVDTFTEYAFTTTGGVGAIGGLTTEDGIDAEHDAARGAVGGGRDSYRFAGDLAAFSMSSDAQVFIDGERVDITAVLPRTLTIDGNGSYAEYSFEVSGGIAGRHGHSGEDDIDIDTGRVTGAVGGGRDSYAFSGELGSFDLDGDFNLYLDGKRVEPADLLAHTLTVTGAGPVTTYSFAVDGSLKPLSGLTSEDVVSGGTATGAVGSGAESYAFSGAITAFSADGSAEIALDDVPVDTFEDLWMEKTSLPTAVSDAGSGVLDGKLHVYGGIETGTGLDAVPRTLVYDPADGFGGSWTRADDLPRALWGNCGVATDTALYSFGGAPPDAPYSGEPPTDAVFKYTPDAGWTDLTATRGVRCPYPNWVMKGLYNPVDGLIYCLGGGTGDHGAPTATNHGFDGADVSGTYDERRIWTFDPETDRVANPDRARMPEAKRWPTVALVEVDGRQYIHALGGLLGTTGPTASNFRYDVSAGRWTTARPLPTQGTYAVHSNPVIENRVYLTHGMFWYGRPTTDRYKLVAHRYDPVTDTFDTDLPTPRHRRGGAAGGVIDDTLHVVGGHVKRFEQNELHDCTTYNEAFRPSR